MIACRLGGLGMDGMTLASTRPVAIDSQVAKTTGTVARRLTKESPFAWQCNGLYKTEGTVQHSMNEI